MRRNIIRIELKKHEAVFIAFLILLAIVGVTEILSDSTTCSKQNPDFDCSQRGLINVSQLYNNKTWTQTTGFGIHYVNNVPVPEFRNGYQHAVCDLGNATCEYHFDTFNALDFPFGLILHEADTLNLFVGVFSEDVWQAILWIAIISSVYIFLRAMEHFLSKLFK